MDHFGISVSDSHSTRWTRRLVPWKSPFHSDRATRKSFYGNRCTLCHREKQRSTALFSDSSDEESQSGRWPWMAQVKRLKRPGNSKRSQSKLREVSSLGKPFSYLMTRRYRWRTKTIDAYGFGFS